MIWAAPPSAHLQNDVVFVRSCGLHPKLSAPHVTLLRFGMRVLVLMPPLKVLPACLCAFHGAFRDKKVQEPLLLPCASELRS